MLMASTYVLNNFHISYDKAYFLVLFSSWHCHKFDHGLDFVVSHGNASLILTE